jgi:polar amino acid transport system substrate-binding protein
MAVKRRWLAYIALFALVALGLFLLFRFPGGEVRDKTWERIEQQGVLRVGMDASYPPFELWDEVGLRGYDVDLALALGREWGVEVDFENITFDGLYDALKVEWVDIIISALPYDPLLTQDVAYSYSYFDAGQVLVVREETAIAKIEDLNGRRVGLESGSRGDLEARRLEQRMILERKAYLSPQEVLEALRDGKVDAAIVDAVSAYQFIGEQGGLRIVQQVTEEPYVIAVSIKAPILLGKVNEAIIKWRETGFLEELREKWF